MAESDQPEGVAVDRGVGRMVPERADIGLLHAAAQAAGLRVVRWDDDGQALRVLNDQASTFSLWNPLLDDGDALRLANKLWLEVRHVHGKAHAGKAGEFWCTEPWFPDGDQDAATRRAIVLAAARLAARETPNVGGNRP